MSDILGELPDDDIEAQPTKSLFVEMLTRDIGLQRAIIDLIDNSIDGARRLRPDVDSSFTGLEVIVELGATRFSITDNCGGIDVKLAKRYAFRIGRPRDMPATPNSVGQFGVGMKRALFKFGRYFEVGSATETERFSMKVDVDIWEADDDNWRFKFDTVETGLSLPLTDTGTRIVVTRLRPSVASSFALDNFRIGLAREIASAEQQYIDRGLRIVVNGHTLIASPWKLMRGPNLEPAKIEHTITLDDQDPINVRIFAGISSSGPRQAGWYIFCNNRMVLEADQSAVTGWSALADSTGVVTPKYHNQFARFRGYVFFDCKSAGLLPWNTTKTGVDEDSGPYKETLLRMVDVMRPIIDFLNQLDAEKDNSDQDKPLTRAVDGAVSISLRDITRSGYFQQPPRVVASGPAMVTISYKKELHRVEDLEEALGARSARQVGERSFELTYNKYVDER